MKCMRFGNFLRWWEIVKEIKVEIFYLKGFEVKNSFKDFFMKKLLII